MKVLLAGATGFLGSNLIPSFSEKGWEVTAIGRNRSKLEYLREKFSVIPLQADLTEEGSWGEAVNKDWDIVINLTGESIFGRWTKKKKRRIYLSRVKATENLLKHIKSASLLISASAVGYYGNAGTRKVTENFLPGEDELSMIVEEWEGVALEEKEKIERIVLLRTGSVISKDSIVIKQMLLPMKFFLGGYPGRGKNFFSWIHLKDFTEAVNFIIGNSEISGPVNLTAPEPVTMKEFCKKIGKFIHRPCWIPVPVPLMALIMGELAFYLSFSQRVIPEKLLTAGYTFQYPDIDSALREIFT